jgi:hypothetical protein
MGREGTVPDTLFSKGQIKINSQVSIYVCACMMRNIGWETVTAPTYSRRLPKDYLISRLTAEELCSAQVAHVAHRAHETNLAARRNLANLEHLSSSIPE